MTCSDPDLVARLLSAVKPESDEDLEHVLRVADEVTRARRAAAKNRREDDDDD